MATGIYQSGSQACTVSTEHQLTTSATETTFGVYQIFLDLNASVKSDIFEVRVYEKARAADTQRQCLLMVIANDQTDDIWVSPALILGAGWKVTLKQTAGTGRTVPWSIRNS